MAHTGPYDETDFPDPAAPPPIPQVTDLPRREDAPYTDEQVLEDFGDLDDFVAPEPKRLPYAGVVYDFPSDVSAQSWLLLQRIRKEGRRAALKEARGEEYDPSQEILNDEEEEFLRDELLGEAQDDLLEDDVPGRVIERMFATIMVWHLVDKTTAVSMWKGDVSSGEAMARPGNRAQRRAGQSRTALRRAAR